MNICRKHSNVCPPAKIIARSLSILAFLLAGLLALGPQAAQANTPGCDPASFCIPYQPGMPEPYDPQLVVTQPTHAYTGPGYDYLNYGDLTLGYVSKVTGISEDREWLLIPFPGEVSPEAQAWVNAGDVREMNIRVLPDWLASCDGSEMTYCGYVLARTTTFEQVLPEWLANCDPNSMTYCAYVLARSAQYIPVKQPSAYAVKFGTK